MFDQAMLTLMGEGIWETLYMTLASTLLAYVFGLPLGVLLVVTDEKGILPCKPLKAVLDVIVNVTRSIPFLILMIAVIPFTRAITGTSIGANATVAPLVLAAIPFVGRMVESSIREVDAGVVEAAQSMGATPFQIICRVMIPEALPSLVNGAAIATTTILRYSADGRRSWRRRAGRDRHQLWLSPLSIGRHACNHYTARHYRSDPSVDWHNAGQSLG